MSTLDQIVNVSIERGTKTITRQGFGVPLIIGSNGSVSFGTDLIRSYSDLDEVVVDFASTTSEYKLATAIFSQDVRPPLIKIGRCGVPYKLKVNIDVATISNSTVYSVYVNDTKYSYTSDASATAAEIVTGLIAAITVGAEPVTLTDNTTNFDIEANVAGTDFTTKVALDGLLLLTSTSTYTSDISDALDAIRIEDDDFYFVHTTSRTKSDIKDIAASIETMDKIYLATTFDTDVTTTATDDVISELQALNYDRTGICYTISSDNELTEAWVGIMAPKDPGSATWMFKNASGVIADEYTSTIRQRILDKGGNIYENVGGLDIFEEGKVVSGEFIDIIRGIDWLKANIQENVYSTLVNVDKIPYTNAGIDSVKSAVLEVLTIAVGMGILSADPVPTVTAPDVSTISSANKLARNLPDVEFDGTLAGAIHKVEINGKLTI